VSLRARLSENTSKHHRKKTSEEEAGEHYSEHLQLISEKHAEVCESHVEAAESEEIDDSQQLDQFMVSDFIKMKDDLAEKQVAQGESVGITKATGASKEEGMSKKARTTKANGMSVRAENRARMVQGNLFSQLAIAFMNRSDHYHHAELIDVKMHQTWMPGFQGVRKTTPERLQELLTGSKIHS
jgi:hypothetical protein